MTTAFSLSQTRERLSAFAAATTMTLAVMAGITTLAQPERADGVVQAQARPAVELPVPGQKYTFGLVKGAQARGDLEVLFERGRRALRVHLPRDVTRGLGVLATAFEAALKR